MSNNTDPGNTRVIPLFIAFLILFVVLFSLGVIVGKGLSERETIIVEKIEPAPPRAEIPRTPVQRGPQELEEIKERNIAPDAPLREESYQSIRVEEPVAVAVDESIKERPGSDVPKPVEPPSEQAARKRDEVRELSRAAPVTAPPPAAESTVKTGTKDKAAEGASIEEKIETDRKKRAGRVKLPPVDPDGKYTVQIGSFIDERTAQSVLRSMENKGYPAFINTMTAKDKKKWYRVRVGTFNSLETAEKYGESLKVLEPEVKVVFITQNN
jgi:cell division septation protein DedD